MKTTIRVGENGTLTVMKDRETSLVDVHVSIDNGGINVSVFKSEAGEKYPVKVTVV